MAAFQPTSGQSPPVRGRVEEHDEVTIRFAGDASDGMQLACSQFSAASALCGNHVGTSPDFPAEIRAPSGTLANVAGFQVHISSYPEPSTGDVLQALVAMNPAALRTHLGDLIQGGLLIVNTDTFTPEELHKAGYTTNPLQDGSLHPFQLSSVPMNQRHREAVARTNLSTREADRGKNFFVLGLVFWLYQLPLEPTLRWIRAKYEKNPAMIEANSRTLKAGYDLGASNDHVLIPYRVGKAPLSPGRYRIISGIDALASGLLTASHQSRMPLVFSCFPTTPVNELLHTLCENKFPNVKVIQAEDDLAALQIALGAAFGGALGVAATSGPGLALHSEALGLAVISELPCVLIQVQRAGPSLGMPSKTEQSDLWQALYGRPGECPLVVLAAATPSDGFSLLLEALRLAVRSMTPVILLTDTHLMHSAETWRIPSMEELPLLEIQPALPSATSLAPPVQTEPTAAQTPGAAPFLPYQRDDRLVRPWAVPGTPGQEHCTGGLEKENLTGKVSFDPLNHEWMVQTRAKKIANIAEVIPPLLVEDESAAELLVLSWGSTYSAIRAAVRRCRRKGLAVASAHLRYLHPLPKNTGAVLQRFRRLLVPELNSGQLCHVLRATFRLDPVSLNKVQGRPFLVREIEQKIEAMLAAPAPLPVP